MVMDENVLAATVRAFLAEGVSPTVFAWQGGEPTLAGVEFYREALRLQMRFAGRGQRVINTLQTNGVLIDDEWARFLAANRFLVGVSIDGPGDAHDAVRRSPAGVGSHASAVRAWRLLRERGCEANVLCVVHGGNSHQPSRTYEYLTGELGAEYLQFIPYIARPGSAARPAPGSYGSFLTEVFQLWAADSRSVSVRLLDDIVLFLAGKPMRDCMHRGCCDSHLVVESDGSVYPCDFCVDPECRLGDMTTRPVHELAATSAARMFRRRKRNERPPDCSGCRHADICQAGCCRFWGRDSEGRLRQKLCADTLFFLDRCRPTMEQMAASIRRRWRETDRPTDTGGTDT